MTIRAIFFTALLLPGCGSPKDATMSFAEAEHAFSLQPKNAETKAYSHTWEEFNNTNHLDEKDGCYSKAEGSLVQLLIIDSEGRVVGYFADKDNGRSQCWRRTYMGVTFPKPPFAPFYYRLEMSE